MFTEKFTRLKNPYCSITSRDDISDIILALSTSSHQLKELYLKYCQSLTPYSDLTGLAIGCGMLETINLAGSECFLCMHSIFGQFKNLTELNLFQCKNLHSKALVNIAEVCENLEKLNIDETSYLSDDSINTLIYLRGDRLKMLWIDGGSLSDESFCNFEKMDKLELLSISFSFNMGARGLASIAKLEKLGDC